MSTTIYILVVWPLVALAASLVAGAFIAAGEGDER